MPKIFGTVAVVAIKLEILPVPDNCKLLPVNVAAEIVPAAEMFPLTFKFPELITKFPFETSKEFTVTFVPRMFGTVTEVEIKEAIVPDAAEVFAEVTLPAAKVPAETVVA